MPAEGGLPRLHVRVTAGRETGHTAHHRPSEREGPSAGFSQGTENVYEKLNFAWCRVNFNHWCPEARPSECGCESFRSLGSAFTRIVDNSEAFHEPDAVLGTGRVTASKPAGALDLVKGGQREKRRRPPRRRGPKHRSRAPPQRGVGTLQRGAATFKPGPEGAAQATGQGRDFQVKARGGKEAGPV